MVYMDTDNLCKHPLPEFERNCEQPAVTFDQITGEPLCAWHAEEPGTPNYDGEML